MDLYLQFGHGMMEHCRQLTKAWGESCTILSPRDLEHEQLQRLSEQLISSNGKTLLDPQFYNPHADHHRLTNHSYWPNGYATGLLNGGELLFQLLERLRDINNDTNTEEFIIPGLLCENVNDDWIHIQNNIIRAADDTITDKPKLATVCVSQDVLHFEEQVELLLNCSEQWNVDGYYVVPEKDQYLVDNPLWLSNLMILCSGLKLQGRKVIVGYCNHQMICLAASNVDALASGTFKNVRSFSRNKFDDADEDSTSRRTKWYYCPHSFSEYKIPFLDIAFQQGVLNSLRVDASISTHVDILFSGAQPTLTECTERDLFRHYLCCLRNQISNAHQPTFGNTIQALLQGLDEAEMLIRSLHRNGIRGQDRDFLNYIDVNRSAIQLLQNSRGFVLERSW